MTLVIFHEYTKLRKAMLNGQINIKEVDSKVEEHKAKITMDMILKFLHEGKEDDEEVQIEKKSFLHFTWRIQRKLGNENLETLHYKKK